MEIECPFWKVCGPGEIISSFAERFFSVGDQKRENAGKICRDKKEHQECEYFKLREERSAEK